MSRGEVEAFAERWAAARAGVSGLGPGSLFADVRRFHHATNLVVGEHVGLLSHEAWARRSRLILEELAEVAEAHAARDLPEFADGLADLVWVVLGTAVEAGLPFDAVWAEVRRSNMAKVGGTLDSSGKLRKPPGWSPPDIVRVLDDHRCPGCDWPTGGETEGVAASVSDPPARAGVAEPGGFAARVEVPRGASGAAGAGVAGQ